MLSVIGQSVFPDIEYIIVDGGSSDGTLDILEKHSDKIDILISEPDRGVYDAMNKGVRRATASWVCFMNAGDALCAPDTIERLALDRTSADRIVFGDCFFVYADGHRVYEAATPFFDDPRRLKGIGICHQSTYTPTQWLLQHPFNWQEFPICADYEFLYYCWESGKQFEYRKQPLTDYAYGDGLSSSPDKYLPVFRENAKITHTLHTWAYYRGWIRVFRQMLRHKRQMKTQRPSKS